MFIPEVNKEQKVFAEQKERGECSPCFRQQGIDGTRRMRKVHRMQRKKGKGMACKTIRGNKKKSRRTIHNVNV